MSITCKTSLTTCFNTFKNPIAAYKLPERFTFPFYYQPHPLCELAVSELQAHLNTQQDWVHNFGISSDEPGAIGKMFGVLLVQNKNNEIGYLAAFSGKLADSNHLPKFVPPVFDVLDEDSFYLSGQIRVNALTTQIKQLENNPLLAEADVLLKQTKTTAETQIEIQRLLMIENKKQRKIKRTNAAKELSTADFVRLNDTLGKESVAEKNTLKYLKHDWQEKIAQAKKNIPY